MEEEQQLTKKERRALAREVKIQERERQEKASNFKKFAIWAVVLVVVGFLSHKAYRFITQPTPEVTSASVEVTDEDWVKGDKEGSVTLIEYGDFQCPACVSYYPLVKKLFEETQSGLKIVYRHYPLTRIHKNAYPAARASEVAGRQGKFWEMHDMLFEKNGEWVELRDPKDKFREFAKEIGLDESKFIEDFDSKEVGDAVNADILSGNQLGVNSTPTFYLNGEKIQPKGYEEFKKIVDNKIKENSLE